MSDDGRGQMMNNGWSKELQYTAVVFRFCRYGGSSSPGSLANISNAKLAFT